MSKTIYYQCFVLFFYCWTLHSVNEKDFDFMGKIQLGQGGSNKFAYFDEKDVFFEVKLGSLI